MKNGIFKNLNLYFKLLKLIWEFDKTYFFVSFLDALLIPILWTYLAWVTALFVNEAALGQVKSLYDVKVLYLVIAYTLTPVFISIFDVFKNYSYNRFYVFGMQKMEIKLLEKKATIDIQTLENDKFNDLLEKTNSHFGRTVWISTYIFLILESIISLCLAIVVLGVYDWYLVVIMIFAVAPILFLEVKYGQAKWGIWDADASERRKYNEFARPFEKPNSMIEMKIFQNAFYFKNLVQSILQKFNTKINMAEKIKAKREFLANIFMYILATAVTLYLMDQMITGAILIGTFTFLLSRIFAVKTEASSLFKQVGTLVGEKKFFEDVFNFLDTKQVLKNGKQKLTAETPDIEFKNVSFFYPDTDKIILKNLNLRIKAGEKIAIVGVNGAGKTTFTKLMMRFYDVSTGEILLNGKNIKNFALESYYSKIGYLSQDYARYKLTIGEAIAVSKVEGVKSLNLERVIAAGKMAGAHEFIVGLENDYDTQLGKEFDGGIEPSVGQWQKLALARLFYKDPQIYILDEPTANIDSVAELEIFEKLENLPKDKTVILISHRFNTVKNADKIVVVEHGEIVEIGSHSVLMRLEDGHYKKMFEGQKESFG